VAAAAVLASPAPIDAATLDWFADQAEDNRQDAALMLRDPAAARVKFEAERDEILATTASQLLDMHESVVSAVDRVALSGELADYYVWRDRDSLGAGIEGWWEDSWATLRPWGFNVGEIRCPVLVMHGRLDRFVPVQHSEWLAAAIPGAESAILDSDGHLTLWATRIPGVHDWLTRRFR